MDDRRASQLSACGVHAIAFRRCHRALFGPAPAVIAELFATPDRSRWSAVSYAIAAAVFGGFAPFIAVWLTTALDSPLAPAGYVVTAAATSLLVVWNMPETAHRPIS